MIDDAAEKAMTVLTEVREQYGPDAAVDAAKLMIEAAAAWIAKEHGPNEARRILQIVGLAQGQAS